MSLRPWQERWASEEANHFNPAYCGALIFEFVRAYHSARKVPPSFALLFCALPIALHPATRARLPRTIRTQLFPWLEDNRDVRVGFADRARNLTPMFGKHFAMHWRDGRFASMTAASWFLDRSVRPSRNSPLMKLRRMFATPSRPFANLLGGSLLPATHRRFLGHGGYGYELQASLHQRLQSQRRMSNA